MVDGRAADNGNGNDDVSLPGGGVFKPQFNELGTTRDDSHTGADDAAGGNPFFDEYASDRRAPGASGDRAKPTDQPVLVQQRVSDDGRVINEYHIYAQVLNINSDSRGPVPASVEQMEGTGERLCNCGHGSVRPGGPDGQFGIPIGGRTNYYGPHTYSSMYRNPPGEVVLGDNPSGDGRVTEQQVIAGLVTAGLVGRDTRMPSGGVFPQTFPIPGRNPGYPPVHGQFARGGMPPFSTPPFVDNSGGVNVTIDVGQPFRGGPDNFNNRFVAATERHETAMENRQRSALRALAYHNQLRARKGYDS